MGREVFLMDFANLISTMGFPIACTVAMFYLLEKERDAHREETRQMTEAISNNTKIMERVLEILRRMEGANYED
jgi:hypothetical protein